MHFIALKKHAIHILSNSGWTSYSTLHTTILSRCKWCTFVHMFLLATLSDDKITK